MCPAAKKMQRRGERPVDVPYASALSRVSALRDAFARCVTALCGGPIVVVIRTSLASCGQTRVCARLLLSNVAGAAHGQIDAPIAA